MRAPVVALALLALLAGQQLAVVAASNQQQQTDEYMSTAGHRKLLIIPLLIKGIVFAATTKAKVAAAGAKVGAVLGSAKTANVLAGAGLGVAIAQNAQSSTVCDGSCAGQVPAAEARASVNGGDNEGCLCSAVGAGVHPNIFDNTCGSFFHCPGPKRTCGPGTLFNPETRVCDWPDNVKCVAVRT